MISPEQLAGALERLDPRDRELLLLSLRRRVPDESLSRLYACTPGDVAKRRAAAIERLADDLGVKRGEDFGMVLQGLLDVETWTVVAESGKGPSGAGAEFAADTQRRPPEQEPRVYRLPTPAPAGKVGAEAQAEAPPAPVELPPPTPIQKEQVEESPPVETEPAEPEAQTADAAPPDHVPVLGMLADADPHKPTADAPPKRRRPTSAVILAAVGLTAFAALAGFVGARELGGDSTPAQGGGDGGVRHFVPQERGPLGAAPFPSVEQDTSCYPTAYVTRPTTLYQEPGGKRLIRIAAKTEWGSPRVLGVTSQREGWLAVTTPELANGEVGWLPRAEARVDCVRWSLHADLSQRTLYVRRDGQTVKKLTVAVGSVRHPTPEGRFSVTDKLKVSDPNSPYGCCVLALSGHQTKLPDDWPGGDRLAVHATTDVDSIGEPVSLGCMRVTSDQARWLIDTIPLGSPIFIRA
jgi:hypothetical protein